MGKLEIQMLEPFEVSVAGFDAEATFVTIPTPTGRISGYMGELKVQLSYAATNQLILCTRGTHRRAFGLVQMKLLKMAAH